MAPGLNLPPPSAPHDPDSNGDLGRQSSSSSSRPRPQATVEDVDEIAESSTSAAAAKPRFATGGIIYPPPDIRYIVDRTASLIAKRGAAFEERIKGDERANTKFAFLNDGDSFNAYYKAKIEAIRDGTGPLADSASPAGAGDAVADGPGGGQVMRVDGREAMDEEREAEQSKRPPEPQPQLFVAQLPNISAVDLDIIKLTALFVARKGKSFTKDLLERERNSNQFAFMRPQHSLFGLYSRLVEQYRLVMHPPTDLMESLEISSGSRSEKVGMGAGGARQHVLQQAKQRADWERWMDQKRKERVDQEEEEKAAFAEIDWQDFVVVATVEITEADQHIDLPVPMSLREVENMTMAQKKMAAMIEEEEGADETERIESVGIVDLPGSSGATAKQSAPSATAGEGEMEMDSGDEEQPSNKPPSSAPPPPSSMKIRKDYVPKTLAERQRESLQQTTKCPVCGETVLTNEMEEHVRIELLNPAYRQQRADIESRRAQQAALSTGADPSRFLRQFAGNRTDIFGLQDQESAAAKREEEERRKAKEREKVIWDGHAASRTRTREDFNRPDMVDSTMKDIQGRFKARDTDSIGPQMPSAESSGVKRPAEDGIHAHEPPSQRPAYEMPPPQGVGYAAAPPMAPSAHPGYPMGPPPPSTAYSTPPPPAAASTSSITLHLALPDSRSINYPSLPTQSTTVVSIRDKLQIEEFPNIGASRIKLKCKRNGKMLNLKMTLLAAGLVDGDVVEVSVK
ncbi:unnamed protein product [Sympodiomycopsis kandeliae]